MGLLGTLQAVKTRVVGCEKSDMQNDYFCPGPRFGKKTIYLENFSELKVSESMLGSFMYNIYIIRLV